MKEFWESFFKFLKELFPALTAFFIGQRVGEAGKEKIRATKDALELELKRIRAREEVDKNNAGRSDGDIIDEAIASGRKSEVPDKG